MEKPTVSSKFFHLPVRNGIVLDVGVVFPAFGSQTRNNSLLPLCGKAVVRCLHFARD